MWEAALRAWKYNIKKCLAMMEGVDWPHIAAVVNCFIHLFFEVGK
jgi:hypothetical protein